MTAAAVTTRRNLPANGESTKREDQFLSPRIVAREAAKVLVRMGLEIRPAALRLLVTGFIREGRTSLAEIEPFILSYCDPTGETAWRNVDRERGWR